MIRHYHVAREQQQWLLVERWGADVTIIAVGFPNRELARWMVDQLNAGIVRMGVVNMSEESTIDVALARRLGYEIMDLLKTDEVTIATSIYAVARTYACLLRALNMDDAAAARNFAIAWESTQQKEDKP